MADYGRIGWRTTVLIVAVALAVVVGMIILGNTDSDSRPRPRPSVSGPPSMSTLVFATWGSDEELDAYQQIVEDYNRTSTVVDVRVDGYADQPKVINGASDLCRAIFGEAGAHARAAVGVNALPLDAAVEIEALFEVSD